MKRANKAHEGHIDAEFNSKIGSLFEPIVATSKSERIRDRHRGLIDDITLLVDLLCSRGKTEILEQHYNSSAKKVQRVIDEGLQENLPQSANQTAVDMAGIGKITIRNSKPVPRNTRTKRFLNAGDNRSNKQSKNPISNRHNAD